MNYVMLIQQMAETILEKMRQSLEEVKCDRTITATVDNIISSDKIRVIYNGMPYTVSTNIGCSVGDAVRVCVPANDWNDLFVLINISKSNLGIYEGIFTQSGWTGSAAPYSQKVAIQGIVGSRNYERYSALTGSETASQVETYNKNLALIFAGESSDGYMTLYASAKPSADIKIRFKEV